MKILGIMGSPRKGGNTDVLLQEVLKGAESAGAETEIVYVTELSVEECNGCHVCWKTGSCCRKDDMIHLYGKIEQSDILVFGTPVYWYGPTALMKAVIDRFVYFNSPENRGKISGKGALTVIPFEENDLRTVKPVSEFFEKCFNYLELGILGSVVAPGVTEKGEVSDKADIMGEAFQIGVKAAELGRID